MVLPARYARRLQAFLKNEADEAGAFRPGHGMVGRPQGNRRGRQPEGKKIHRPGNHGRRL